MMMITMTSKFMLDECAGGCKGRLLIDIFDHTHCTNMMYCLQCHCNFLGSFAALFCASMVIRLCSRFATTIRDVRRQQARSSDLFSHIGAPFQISSGWLSVGLCSVSTVHKFSASLMKAQHTVAVSVYLRVEQVKVNNKNVFK